MTANKPLILHISKHFLPVYGGLERVIEGTIFYTKHDFTSEVMCYNDDLNGSINNLKPFEVVNSIKINRIKCIKTGWFHFGLFKLPLLMKADIIHVHNCDLLLDYIILLKILTGFKAKIIASSHGLVFHHNKLLSLKIKYLKLTFLMKNKTVDKFIATGLNDYHFLIQKMKSVNTELFENPIEMKYLVQSKTRNGILSVNRLQNSKNMERNIVICENLSRNGFSEAIRFIVSGNQTEIDQLISVQKVKNPNFIFIINCTDQEKWIYFSESKYFIHSAEYEGFGISVLESLLSGCLTFVTKQVEGNFKHHNFDNLFSFFPEDSNNNISKFILSKKDTQLLPIEKSKLLEFDWVYQSRKITDIYKSVLLND